ncbi:hypothetical protein LL045_07900 [Lactococcus lactis subsp. lactis]|uniref:hypothetical protein n=1 Tax=Lactococcus lactis TaxID=1358 RepID=UPI003749A59C
MDKTFHYSGLANYGAIKSFEVDKKSKDQHVSSSKVLTAVFIGTLSVTSFAVNTPKDNNLFLTNLVDKKIVKKFSNIKNKKSVPLFNKKEVDGMSEKMNATETLIVQHIKSSEERLARVEGKIDRNYEEVYKELKNISSNAAVQKEQIENIQKEMKELPHKVKSEIKIERNDKIISLIWAPIITGVIILIVQVALHQFNLM